MVSKCFTTQSVDGIGIIMVVIVDAVLVLADKFKKTVSITLLLAGTSGIFFGQKNDYIIVQTPDIFFLQENFTIFISL